MRIFLVLTALMAMALVNSNQAYAVKGPQYIEKVKIKDKGSTKYRCKNYVPSSDAGNILCRDIACPLQYPQSSFRVGILTKCVPMDQNNGIKVDCTCFSY